MIRWISARAILAVHDELIREHGGTYGVRDEDALESALARPLNRHAYDRTQDLNRLAAALGYGISRNHPFVDGNKRTALMAMFVFLDLNGVELVAAETEAVDAMEALASGSLDEDELAAWLQTHTRKRPKRAR
ncbi:MAG: death-on-curing protein [Candidatus Hydrogenedentota bacterium]